MVITPHLHTRSNAHLGRMQSCDGLLSKVVSAVNAVVQHLQLLMQQAVVEVGPGRCPAAGPVLPVCDQVWMLPFSRDPPAPAWHRLLKRYPTR